MPFVLSIDVVERRLGNLPDPVRLRLLFALLAADELCVGDLTLALQDVTDDQVSIGTAAGLATGTTIVLSIALAFAFGYTLSTLPLLRGGLAIGAALSVVLAADTLSILTMEIVDNAVMAVLPGAMDAGLVSVVFWLGMMIALSAAFVAAYPVNRYLLRRGKGHALTHEYHHGDHSPTGWLALIPTFSTGALAGVVIAFMIGGLVVAVADELGASTESHSAPVRSIGNG